MLGNYIATYSIDIAALAFLGSLIFSNNVLDQNRKRPFYRFFTGSSDSHHFNCLF